MLYFDFKDYEGFKERFGITEHGNGAKSRKNKILLAYVKQPELLRSARITGDYRVLNMRTMPELWSHVLREFMRRSNKYYYESSDPFSYIEILNMSLYSKKYKFDTFNGICEDGDVHCVRYINMENNRVFKMKAGKFLSKLMEENGFSIPDQVRLWMCEEFARRWEAHVASYGFSDFIEPTHLVVDDDFEAIYSNVKCDGYFGSCMQGKPYWSFYRDAVNAKAASLRRDRDGVIVARCVIYMDARDEDGRVYRLAERQYAPSGKFDTSSRSNLYNSIMKRALVDALIEGGYIDGYKQIGAGCGDNRAFIAIDGTSLSDKEFTIPCNLDDGDVVSYQDSFGYYSHGYHEAYNFAPCDYDNDDEDNDTVLKTTHGYWSRGNWDSWNDRWTRNRVITVYSGGNEYTIDTESDDFEDYFVDVHGDYYHVDDCFCCPRCGQYELIDDGYYSELTEETYCCESCKEDAEESYKSDNWYFCDYDGEYVEFEDEMSYIQRWGYYLHAENGHYYEESIKTETLQELIDNGDVIECDGKWYELPYTEDIGIDVEYGYRWDNYGHRVWGNYPVYRRIRMYDN